MTEIQKAWLAGFIDGEGSIGIYRVRSKNSRFPYDFGIRIVAVNTNLEVMRYLKCLTGCGCSYVSKGGCKPNWRPCHRWQAVAENARGVIREILPYLKVKRAIAELVLTMPLCSKTGRSVQDFQNQDRIFAAAKAHNRRGLTGESE